MIDKQFEKEEFKKSVKENVKFLYRKTLEEATQEQIFQAVSYTVKDVIIDNWLKSQKAYEKQYPPGDRIESTIQTHFRRCILCRLRLILFISALKQE